MLSPCDSAHTSHTPCSALASTLLSLQVPSKRWRHLAGSREEIRFAAPARPRRACSQRRRSPRRSRSTQCRQLPKHSCVAPARSQAKQFVSAAKLDPRLRVALVRSTAADVRTEHDDARRARHGRRALRFCEYLDAVRAGFGRSRSSGAGAAPCARAARACCDDRRRAGNAPDAGQRREFSSGRREPAGPSPQALAARGDCFDGGYARSGSAGPPRPASHVDRPRAARSRSAPRDTRSPRAASATASGCKT